MGFGINIINRINMWKIIMCNDMYCDFVEVVLNLFLVY